MDRKLVQMRGQSLDNGKERVRNESYLVSFGKLHVKLLANFTPGRWTLVLPILMQHGLME